MSAVSALSSVSFDVEDEVTGQIAVLGALVTTPVISVTLDTSLDHVRELLVERRVSAIVVIDDHAMLVGLLTRTDVLRAGDAEQTAADAMSHCLFTLPECAAIERAAALMAFEGVGQIVVTGPGGELVGLVSSLDIARHFAIEAGYLVDDGT